MNTSSIFLETDFCDSQMGILLKDDRVKNQSKHLQQLNEIGDMIQNPQYKQSDVLVSGIQQLHYLSVTLQNEGLDSVDGLSISFASVEIQIAKCISECLGYSPEQNKYVSQILKFVKDYKVVQSLPGKRHTVSLHKVHLILQDNYSNSSLYGLFSLLLCGRNNGVTKVITF